MGKRVLEIMKGTRKSEAGGEQEKKVSGAKMVWQTRIAITFKIHSQKYHIVEEANNIISAHQRRQNFKYCISDTSQKKKGKKKKNNWTDTPTHKVNYLWLLKSILSQSRNFCTEILASGNTTITLNSLEVLHITC